LSCCLAIETNIRTGIKRHHDQIHPPSAGADRYPRRLWPAGLRRRHDPRQPGGSGHPGDLGPGEASVDQTKGTTDKAKVSADKKVDETNKVAKDSKDSVKGKVPEQTAQKPSIPAPAAKVGGSAGVTSAPATGSVNTNAAIH
jgi:hypothetical protein